MRQPARRKISERNIYRSYHAIYPSTREVDSGWALWMLYVRRSPDRRSRNATSAAARAPPLSTSRSLTVSAMVCLPTKYHSEDLPLGADGVNTEVYSAMALPER